MAFSLDLPLAACAATIGAAIWVNIFTTLTSSPNDRLSDRRALFALLFDLLQLSILLFLTGGLTNPFALFLLAPITIAVSVLSLRSTWILTAVCVGAATVLWFQHLPLRFTNGEPLDPPFLHVAEFWAAIALCAGFLTVYARRVSMEAFNMSAALTATQMALEREQRISAIGALAAAAAHELGTPLATIKLVANELKDELEKSPELAEDVALIAEQAKRCQRILERLSVERSPDDAQIRFAPISALLEEAAGPHMSRRAEVIIRLNGDLMEAAGPTQPQIPRRPEIIHGLRNIVQNAVDFAASTVWIDVETSERFLTISVGDDGGGFSNDVLAQLGEPFLTTRGKAPASGRDAYQGMGLGVFISKTLLERSGAEVSFQNAFDTKRDKTPLFDHLSAEWATPTGAIVNVRWPLDRLRVDAGDTRLGMSDKTLDQDASDERRIGATVDPKSDSNDSDQVRSTP